VIFGFAAFVTGFLPVQFIGEFVHLFMEMAPWLLLGFFFAGLLHVYVPRSAIPRYMGKSNLKSSLNAALLGIPLPLCSCGVIPTGIGFHREGASKGSTVSFLISTPQTGIDSILATYSLLGLPFAVMRPVVAFFSGILGGAVTNSFQGNNSTPPPVSFDAEPGLQNQQNKLITMAQYAFYEFLMAGPATNTATIAVIAKAMGKKTAFLYVASIIVSAFIGGMLINNFLPREWFTQSLTHLHHHTHVLIPAWIQYASGAVLAALLLFGYAKKYAPKWLYRNKKHKPVTMNTIKIKVKGMTCHHCKINVEKAISAIKGVDHVDADPVSSLVIITGTITDPEAAGRKVEELGYEYIGEAR
jgi:uncharacterized membrane protein YraQ (UPF0718 family)/copper chaperone CopZ